MKKSRVLYFLTELYSDWEASYAVAILNSHTDIDVETVSVDGLAKVSMGGLVTSTDYATYNCYLDNVAMVIIPGGLSWEENSNPVVYDFIKKCIDKKIVIATIGGASNYLARNGFLDNIKHTADPLDYISKYEGYHGHDFYIDTQLVFDGGIITANETALVAFAYEIFKHMGVASEREVESLHRKFKELIRDL